MTMKGRAKRKNAKGQDRSSKGDCIDCKLCVRMSYGIDIRRNTVECVNCGHIDVCDDVMTKVGRKRDRFVCKSQSDRRREEVEAYDTYFSYAAVLLSVSVLGFSLVTALRLKQLCFELAEP